MPPPLTAPLTMSPRAAGYVVLTSMAAGLELIRNGWRETRTDDTPADPAHDADDTEPVF